MLRLIRQNPAVRSLPRWLIISAVSATFLLNTITFVALKYGVAQTGLDPVYFGLILWFVLTLYLIFGEVGTRCSPMDMALPIPARKLWLSHLFAVMLAGVAILTVTVGLTTGGVWLLWKLEGQWLMRTKGIFGLAAQMSAGLILAVVILQSPRPALQKIGRTRRRGVSALVVMGLMLGLIMLLRQSAAYAIALLAAAALAGYLRSRSVPVSFALVPREAERTAGPQERPGLLTDGDWAAATALRSTTTLGFKWFVIRTVQKCSVVGIKKKLTPWFTMPFLFLFGAGLAGIADYATSESLRYALVPMVVYLLMAFTGIPLNRLGMVDALPITRRLLFAVIIFPSFLAVIAGYAAGWVGVFFVEKYRDQRPELIEFFENKEDNRYYVHVPIEYCEISWSGRPPIATSPWGETAEVWRTSLFKPSPVKIYIPYGVDSGSSLDFVAMQISRATEAVYGEAIAPDFIKDRYIAVRDDGVIVPRGEALTIQADFPHLREREGGPVFPVIILLTGLLWLALLYLYLFSFRAGITKGKKTLIHWLVVGIALLLWIGQFALAVTGIMMPHVTAGFFDIIARRSGETAAGTLAVWVVCGLVLWGAYSIVERRFARAEIPREEEACG